MRQQKSIQLQNQQRLPSEITKFHEWTNWNLYDAPSVTLRISATLADVTRYQSFSLHGKVYAGAPTIALSGAADDVQDIFTSRQSARELSDEPLTTEELASVLQPALLRTRKCQVSDKHFIANGPYPSAGGLYPIEVYAIIPLSARQAREDRTANVYHYNTITSELSLINVRPLYPDICNALGFGRRLRPFGTALVFTSMFGRSVAKYGSRGYRFSLLEAGHVAQNILLACPTRKLAAFCWGGYADDCVHKLLGLDGIEECAVHCIFMGHMDVAASDTPTDDF
jgi:SagB-type dehydrogenase family enzyme